MTNARQILEEFTASSFKDPKKAAKCFAAGGCFRESPNAASRRRAVWFSGYSEVGSKSAWRRSAVMSWEKVQEGLLLECCSAFRDERLASSFCGRRNRLGCAKAAKQSHNATGGIWCVEHFCVHHRVFRHVPHAGKHLGFVRCDRVRGCVLTEKEP
jgi:hypothetical protein